MPFLGEPRLREILTFRFIICAGILPVRIKKQGINAIIDIVMMMDVAPREPLGVAAPPPVERRSDRVPQTTDLRRCQPGQIAAEQVEKIVIEPPDTINRPSV
jgi:hypothetical protein